MMVDCLRPFGLRPDSLDLGATCGAAEQKMQPDLDGLLSEGCSC